MDNNVEIRRLRRNDIVDMFGHPLRQTCRGWAVEYRGGLACIAGVIITKNLIIAFSKIRDGIDAPRSLIWTTAQRLWEKIKGLGYPVLYAIADPALPGAPAFLARLGFEHIESDVRGEVFKWQIQ